MLPDDPEPVGLELDAVLPVVPLPEVVPPLAAVLPPAVEPVDPELLPDIEPELESRRPVMAT
jgi:hypothetical protein